MLARSACKCQLPLLLLIALPALLAVAGCTTYPANPHGEIQMDDWCDHDPDKPWTGCWEEIGQISCESDEKYVPEDSIGEFRLRADAVYSVTRHPFEHFVDYAGTYTVALDTNTILFSPIDISIFDGDGKYDVTDNGELILRDIWFGVYGSMEGEDSNTAAVPCGYVFARK